MMRRINRNLKSLIVISTPIVFPYFCAPYLYNFCSASFLIIVPLADVLMFPFPNYCATCRYQLLLCPSQTCAWQGLQIQFCSVPLPIIVLSTDVILDLCLFPRCCPGPQVNFLIMARGPTSLPRSEQEWLGEPVGRRRKPGNEETGVPFAWGRNDPRED